MNNAHSITQKVSKILRFTNGIGQISSYYLITIVLTASPSHTLTQNIRP